MDAAEDQAQKVFFDPNWIAWNGGFLHSNNVLFYFAQSPFFDRTSDNQSLLTQWGGTPDEAAILGTRASFERHLRDLKGIQFVVEHDPLEKQVMVQGPNGLEQSRVWVIRKQSREIPRDDDSVTILDYFYIVNDAIYQAPSVANILNYRLLNTVSSLNKIFGETSDLSRFSVSHGHTYYKPVQKSTAQAMGTASQRSKENTPAPGTPLPGTQTSAAEKPTSNATLPKDGSASSERVLREALHMTLSFGKEYMDDMQLTGEPGNFRISKGRDTATASNPSSQQKSQPAASIAGTPGPGHSRVPSRAGSTLPKEIPGAIAKKKAEGGDKATPVPDLPMKPKRRKSKVGQSP